MIKHSLQLLTLLGVFTMSSALSAQSSTGASAPTPTLKYAFSVNAQVAEPVEQGIIDNGRRRFIEITGGEVYGPMLQGKIVHGGGDWQSVYPDGFTEIEARYFLELTDGTVVEVHNPGVRVASAEVIEQLTNGEEVDPSRYYFRTTPNFKVAGDKYDWLKRHVFVARGIRYPNDVIIDYYIVE